MTEAVGKERFNNTIKQAVEMAWDMLSMNPPAVLSSFHMEYNDEFHELSGVQPDVGDNYVLTYYRPFMLYHSCGGVATKARVVKKGDL